MKEYDEQQILTEYVWTHFYQFLTPFEFKVGKAIKGREKAANSSSEKIKVKILEAWGGLHDPEIENALKDGPQVYIVAVANRIVEENREEIFINRCFECQRIVGTPKARLCKWCGHTWYDKEVGYRGDE